MMYKPQYSCLPWNQVLVPFIQTKKKLLATLLLIVAFSFLSNKLSAQCRLLNENFNSAPVLAPSNTDGAWYPDRYPPAGFTNDLSRLKISINLNDGAQLRPPAFSSTFYNTQGRKFNQCGKCVTEARADLYIPADWATKHRRSDIWATAFNVANAISAYPIIGFRNVDGITPGIYVYDNVTGLWVNSGVVVTYDSWYTLGFRLTGTNIEYLVNNVVVSTMPALGSTYFGDIIMQAYNFNDANLLLPSGTPDLTADATYDAIWDNLVTTGPGGNVVTNTNTGQTFCSIQSAIDAPLTANGHTLQVSAGTFKEKVIISKQLTIEGAGETSTFVDGAGLGTGSGIYINNGITNVTLRFMTIRNHAGTSPNGFAGIYAVGGNNNLTVEHVSLKDNIGGSGFYANGPINNVVLDDLDVSGHTNVFGAARGIVIWNGFKSNITITNSEVYNNNCCGIELQDGTASGVTMSNNFVHDNSDNGLAAIGLKEGAGPTVITNNTVTNNGRFGIELKNPNANGTIVGDGSVVVSNNNVSFTPSLLMNNRDHAGISVYRRDIQAGNPTGYPDFPAGVMITGNTVSGYKQMNVTSVESKGYGIVIEGIRHRVTGNVIQNNDIGIQEQGGAHPTSNYVANSAGNGEQTDGFSTNYFGRGNAPIACGNTYAPNIFAGNTTNTNSVTANSFGLVQNTNTGIYYCSIQAAIDDPLTVNGNTIAISSSTYNEQVKINKSVKLLGTGSPQPTINFTGIVSGKPTLFDISADGVIIENIHFNVDLSKLKSAIIASNPSIDNITIKDNIIDAYGTPSAGTYGDRNAVSINYTGSTNYRVATGGVDNIVFQGNIVNGSLPTSFFRAGLATDESGLSATGNTIQSINHDIVSRFGSNGPITISNNNFNGGGVELSEYNAGATTITVSQNAFNGAVANTSAPNTAVLRLKNNQANKFTTVNNNTFINADWGISMENYKNVVIENNVMTARAGVTNFYHITVNTKSISTNSSAIVQTQIFAQIQNNTFNGSGVAGGTAVGFYNHDADNASFGAFDVHENSFDINITNDIYQDNQSGPSSGSSVFGYTGNIGAGPGAVTTMAPWTFPINATCNWYGTTNAATIAGKVGPNVTYAPWLVNGTDNNASLGFQPVPNSCSGCPSGNVVQNTNTLKFFCSIQDAINDATTLNGHTIVASAGTYKENVIVNKSLTINGPNAAINPCSGVRVAEAIVMPAVADIAGGEIFHVAASNVTISGFTIDGDNPALTTGAVSTTAADIDAADGVTIWETNINNLQVTNNIIKNLSDYAVSLYDFPAAVPTSGHVIANNKIMDMGTYGPNAYDFWGGGVLIYNNAYAAITNNCMENVRIGVQTGNFHLANPGLPASQVISGNTMAVRRRGVFHNLHYGTASPLTLNNNQITGISNPNESYWDGILLSSLSVASTTSNNTVNGTGIATNPAGIMVWNVGNATPATISGGSLTNLNKGIFVNNYDGYPSSGSNAPFGGHASISGVSISNATTGIYVKDNTLSTHAPVVLNVGPGVTVTGGTDGLLIEGGSASVPSLNNLAFSGQTKYIRLVGSPNNVDATSATFAGLTGAAMTLAQNYATEDMIDHKIDLVSLGFVKVKDLNTFVTVNSFVAPNTAGSIQRGVDAASNGWTVNVNAGTFNENVIANKGVTIRGAGNTTILSPTGPCNGIGIDVTANNVTIDDMQLNGFNTGILVGANSITMSDLLVSSMCNRGIELGNTTDVDIINSTIVNNVVGIRAGSGAVVNDVLMNNLEVHNNTQGIYIAYETAPGSPVFNNVLIQNSDFSNNTQKGMYFEKLSNAVIENIIMNNTGTDVAYNFNAGIDINLKWASYSNITIRNSEFNNVGVPSGASHIESPVVIAVKARDDAPSYNAIPASLSNVTIENNIIKGPQNGIRMGEFGKINNTPTNVQIHNNDLSGPYANKAVINNTPVTTDATCNWWGTVGGGGIAAKIQGPVTYSPFLMSGVDAQPATRGFQPAAACVANTDLYVNDNVLVGDHYTTAAGNDVTGTGTPAAPYATITKAIAMAAAGNTIWVDAGLYVENPVVNKSVTIKGSNFGADARLARPFTESIVRSNGNAAIIFTLGASNITVDGFTVDGDDPAIVGNALASGDDANGSQAFRTSVLANGLNITNNIVKKVEIGFRSDLGMSFGNTISKNWFDAIGHFDFGYAVSIRNNFYADITDNKMTRVWVGAHINNHNGPGGPANFNFTGNEVHSYATGLAYWLNFNQATGLTANNNQFFAEAGAVANNFGILIVTLQDAVNATFTNNSISGTEYGIGAFNIPTSATLTLGSTNSIAGTTKSAILFTNNLNFNPVGTTNFLAGGPGAASTLNVAGIGINSASGNGIEVDASGGTTTTLNVSAPTVLNNGVTGLRVNGATSAITGNAINNLSFLGQTGDYITLTNSALTGLKIDATGSSFDGTTGAAKTLPQLFATENKITHKIEDKNLGFIIVKANNDYVTDIATPTPTNNDYTRVKNAVEVAANNWTVNLNGSFDWTEVNAAAAWALGNDGLPATADDYSILVPANLNGVTFTAPIGSGSAIIQGPGDLAGANLEGVLVFDGGDNQGWTISNMEFLDFDLSIGMFNGAGGSDAFNNTTITNNHIRIATDLNSTVAPIDVNQNIGIHYSFGTNQTISNNVIDIPGNGVSNAPANFSSSVGMQSNTSGGNVYNGLQITGNTINILNAQSANPENILGIWENGHAYTSNISVSNNQFLNLAGGNNAALNLQRAFRITSHSGAATTVTYNNNTANGANIGMQWLAGSNFSGNQPVAVTNNFLNGNNTGILIQSSGSANLFRNTINGGALGVDIQNGGFTTSVMENFIKNNTGDAIRVAAAAGVMGPINKNDLSGTGGFAINNLSTQNLSATCNWYGTTSAPAVAAKINGPVTYVPYLTNGTDADADPTNGFQPTDPCLPCTLTVTSTSSTNASCPGSADGTATVTVTGGSGNYSYLWSNGQTTNPATGLTAGTYNVTITDVNGCSTSTSVVVSQYGPPVVNNPGNQGPYCHHTATTPVVFTSPASTRPGVITYTWTNSAPIIGLPANGTGDIPSFITNNPSTTLPLVAIITVTPHYTYNAVTCSGVPRIFTITVRPASNGTMTGASNTSICAGQGASINVDVNGPTNFTGEFTIREILSPIGPVFGAPTNFGPFTLTIQGPQAVAVPGSYLPNATSLPKTYRIEWNYLRDGNNCDAYPLTGFVDITVNPTTFNFSFCPSPITNAPVNNAGCTALITTNNPVVTITCGSLASLTWTMTGATTDASPPAGINYVGTHSFNVGTTNITYTATDAGGNTRTCFFTVSVVNNLSGSISGTASATQGPGSTPVTFTGSGGTKPYTFTYTVSVNGGPAGPPQTVSTTGGSSSVDVQQSNAATGTYTYTLVSVTDNYGCTGTISGPNSATITVVPPVGRPDLTSGVTQPLNTTFFSGQVKEGYVTLSNTSPDPTTGAVTFRISLVSNFNLEILGTTTSVNPPGGPVTPVNNTDWIVTPGAFFYTLTSKPGVVMAGNSSIKIGFKLTATGGSNSSGIMTVSVIDGTGGSTPANGDNNNTNNQSVKLFSIN